MASQGSVIARVYTSSAYIPLQNAPVTFLQTREDSHDQLLAFRYTNSSGLTDPVYVTTPDASQSQSPGLSANPFAVVDILVSYPGFRSVRAEGVQIFPKIETIQDIQLQPESGITSDQPQIIRPRPQQNL